MRRLQKAVQATGILFPLMALLTVAARVVQQTALNGATYDWLGPLEYLRDELGRTWIGTAIALSLVLGISTGGHWQSVRARLADRLTLYTMLLGGALAFAISWWIYPIDAEEPTHLLDRIGLSIAIGAGFARARGSRAWDRGFYELLLAVLFFIGVSYWFTVVKACLFFGRPPQDAELIALERTLGIDYRVFAQWSAEHTTWAHLLDRIYFALFGHMVVGSVFLTAANMPRVRLRYIAALGFAYMIGALAYYVLPGLGPAFADPDSFRFLWEQEYRTTFIQWLLKKNTQEAVAGQMGILRPFGYIACFPSLHITHELVMLYYSRYSRIFLALSALFTGLSILAVLALGWHYLIDIVPAFVLATIAISIAEQKVVPVLPTTLLDLYSDKSAPSDQPANEEPERG